MQKDFLLYLDGRFLNDVKVNRPVAPASTAEIYFTRDPRKALEGNEPGWSLREERNSRDIPIYIVPGSVYLVPESVEPTNGGGQHKFKGEVHSGPIYDLFE